MAGSYQRQFRIEKKDVDARGQLQYAAILRLSQQISGEHCDLLGFDREFLEKKGLFWAIIRNRVTVNSLPRLGQTITMETWPMMTTHTAYPRATAAYDESGRLLFSCHSLWILMDMQSRAMVLPGKSGVDVPGLDRTDVPAAPRSLSPVAAKYRCTRQVELEDLDQNRHMNNTRYLRWVEDVLPAEFREKHRLADATLCYLNEATLGQTLHICWDFTGEKELAVDICREKDEDRSERIFSAKLQFDDVVL